MREQSDENDISDDEIVAMWEQGKPVDIAGNVTISDTPWILHRDLTGTRLQTLSSTVNFSYFGSQAPLGQSRARGVNANSDTAATG